MAEVGGLSETIAPFETDSEGGFRSIMSSFRLRAHKQREAVMKTGIIGGLGWIGGALGRRLLETGTVAPADLTVISRRPPQSDYYGHGAVHWAASAAELVERSDIVVIAVRPQDWRALDLKAEGKLVVSMMAMVSVADLVSTKARVLRVMPNALAEQARSYSPWFAGPGVHDADKAALVRLLASIGTADEVQSEAHLDVMTVLPGSGPAYPALMATAMLAFARGQGLPEAIARRAVEAAICDGSSLLRGRIETAAETVQTFRDYAGITAAGLDAAEAAGFSTAMQAALTAALRACAVSDKA
ncbi:MAG: NADP oxidoreductase coenzyme dependent [Rhodobacteraceae bacterium]|nr:MAG: NADP oxidoreductase coenzyme dependent [Paracoccaceae bacterium]